MADEIKSESGNKIGLVQKVIMYTCAVGGIGLGGYLHGRYSSEVKNIAIRDVNNDYKEDIVITLKDGAKNAFIKQEDGSYITWEEARKKLYKSVDDSVNQIENEIKK
jgi:hypothetical protein